MMYPNIKAEIARKGITYAELSAQMDLAQSTLSAKLNGKSKFTIEEALKLRDIFDVSMPIEDLFQKAV